MLKALSILAGLSLVACGGRASLHEESGKAHRRLWNAQLDSQPSRGPSTISAADAKIALGAHYGKRKGAASRGSSGYNSIQSGRRQLTPATTDIGGGSGGSGGKITLR